MPFPISYKNPLRKYGPPFIPTPSSVQQFPCASKRGGNKFWLLIKGSFPLLNLYMKSQVCKCEHFINSAVCVLSGRRRLQYFPKVFFSTVMTETRLVNVVNDWQKVWVKVQPSSAKLRLAVNAGSWSSQVCLIYVWDSKRSSYVK